MNRTILAAPLFALALGACAPEMVANVQIPLDHRTPVRSVNTLVDIPAIGSVQTTELGDSLVTKGNSFVYPAVRLLNKLTVTDWEPFDTDTVIAPQTLVALLEDDSYTYYYTKDKNVGYALLGRELFWKYGIRVSKASKAVEVFLTHNSDISTEVVPTPEVKETVFLNVDEVSFRQEFIYDGRVGNSVRFLYRELSNDMMRAPFNQSVQYDLSESPVIGFKGLRIEVLKATNRSIRYKVVRSFPDL